MHLSRDYRTPPFHMTARRLPGLKQNISNYYNISNVLLKLASLLLNPGFRDKQNAEDCVDLGENYQMKP